jgi:hypothetical protein
MKVRVAIELPGFGGLTMVIFGTDFFYLYSILFTLI